MKLNIILASQSPRRRQLLKDIGLKFAAYNPKVKEKIIPGESPKEMVLRLSHAKAKSVLNRLSDDPTLIIGADTCVFLPQKNKILGKPKSKKEALRMLLWLNGKKHFVYTGYCIILKTREKLKIKKRIVKSQVVFKEMNQDVIKKYIQSGEPFDKAGGYAAQGKGMSLIKTIYGSYTNIVGLPLYEIVRDINKILENEKLK